MTDQEARTAPLWEVWDRFNAAVGMIELDDQNAPDTTMGGKWGTPPGEYGRMAAKMVPMLRGVLLERCKRVDDADGWHTKLEIEDIDDTPIIVITFHDQSGEFCRYPRCDTPETARNMSAAYAFMAWELEQRQKESPN